MRREQKPRKIRDTILILTNGKQTEKNYFDNLTSKYKTMFTIKVKFFNGQCDSMVNEAIKLSSEQYNQIWCVFDIDDSLKEGHIISAIQTAQKHGINVAYSNEAFEVWLLYHLSENVRPGLTRRTYGKEINTLLKNEGNNSGYKKNDLELIKNAFLPKALDAAQRAKKIHQRFIVEHQKDNHGNINYPIWDWKSTTTVYKLMDVLQLTPLDVDE